MAYTYVSQWSGGNFGFRLPDAVLRQIGLRKNDKVEISCQDDTITIRKAPFQHRTLEERLTSFYGKPLEEISPISQEELDWGKAQGDEV